MFSEPAEPRVEKDIDICLINKLILEYNRRLVKAPISQMGERSTRRLIDKVLA